MAHLFRCRARTSLGLASNETIFSRIEIDFSKALLGAAVQTFHRKDTREYLRHCWLVLFRNQKAQMPNIHVCRTHVTGKIEEKHRKMYHLAQQRTWNVVDSLITAYLQSGNFASTYRRATQLLTLCGSKYRTPAVLHVLQDYNNRTTEQYAEGESFAICFSCPCEKALSLLKCYCMEHNATLTLLLCTDNKHLWMDFDFDAVRDKSIYKGTPFGALFVQAYRRIQEDNNSVHSFELEKNEYYCKAFCDYLQTHIFPYSPCLTHCFFDATGDFLKEDHQAAVENAFRAIKIDENARKGRDKIGRYLRRRKRTIRGNVSKILQHVSMLNVMLHCILNYTTGAAKKFRLDVMVAEKELTMDTVPPQKKVRRVPKGRVAKARRAKGTGIKEKWRSKKRYNPKVNKKKPSDLDLPGIQFIPWGKRVAERSIYQFDNTCPIDNILMVLQLMYVKFPHVRDFFVNSSVPTVQHMRRMIDHILAKEFNSAKAIWIQDIVRSEKVVLSRKDVNDLFGFEDLLALDPIQHLFHGQFYDILTCRNRNHGPFDSEDINVAMYAAARVNTMVNKVNHQKRRLRCPQNGCRAGVERTVEAAGAAYPPFLFFHLAPELDAEPETLLTLPREICLGDTALDLVGCHLQLGGHFVLVLWEGGQFITYDGTKSGFVAGTPKRFLRITAAWYVRRQ